ncbi:MULTISPECIES: MFS transporter [unclassified Gordonia (in: high G+C Gram-positive bacteria)]|uniref:MFS transporter n=1 Tax=unclassified Gordonia (in: high G+C Gram-positive bacteria) TaxID=2657482 RepID=UPI001F06DA17|nr:MFS transporter [Gordonia sp. PDNC005]
MAAASFQEAEVGAMSIIEAEVTAGRRAAGFVGLATASFLGCIDLTIVSTALPAITRELGTSISVSQLVLSGFLTALAMFMVTAGRVGDQWGRRTVLLAGLGVFVVASVGAALAPGIGWLIVARFVQGASCAVLYTGTSTLVEQLFPEGERGRAVGWLYAVNGVGLAIGPVLGGLLVPAFGWASVFWINVPFGLVAVGLILAAVPSPAPESDRGTDVPGQVALAVAVAAAVAFVSLPASSGWLSAPVIASGVVAVAAVTLLAVVERRSSDPLLRVDLLGHPRLRAALLSDFFLAAFYASALLVLPQYLADRHGLGERLIGVSLLLVSGTMAFASPRVGRWVDQGGPNRPLRFGFASLAVSAGALLAGALSGQIAVLLVGFVFFGLGWALILAPATLSALSAVPTGEAGFAIGASWTFHNLGGALGAAVAAALYASSDADGGLTSTAVFLLVGAVIALAANALIPDSHSTVDAAGADGSREKTSR